MLIAKVWTTAFDPQEIRDEATVVLANAWRDFKNLAISDAYPASIDEETAQFMRYWFDGYARRQLAALSMAISNVRSEVMRNVLWCAFSRLIITKQAGSSRAMDLSHSRPHRVFDVAPEKPFNKFLSAVERVVASGIDRNLPGSGHQPKIGRGDARCLPLENGSVDLVLTSPPYLNAIDYLRCSKFSLVWMGYKISDLRQVRKNSVGTEVGGGALDDNEVRSS